MQDSLLPALAAAVAAACLLAADSVTVKCMRQVYPCSDHFQLPSSAEFTPPPGPPPPTSQKPIVFAYLLGRQTAPGLFFWGGGGVAMFETSTFYASPS